LKINSHEQLTAQHSQEKCQDILTRLNRHHQTLLSGEADNPQQEDGADEGDQQTAKREGYLHYHVSKQAPNQYLPAGNA
jgi:hypothetical protein